MKVFFPSVELQRESLRSRQDGAALVVVMVLLVLMLGVILAFFSQSILQRQVSKSSASQTSAELLADGALNILVGDIKEEILANSYSEDVDLGNGSKLTLYRPKSILDNTPYRSGTDNTLPNLVKRSASDDKFAPGVSFDSKTTRAAAISSEKSLSLNGRFISLARWNKPLLVAAKALDDFTPSSSSFKAPDWILVDREGKNPTTWSSDLKWSSQSSNTKAVIGRYAFAIYNEGGLLDANVAGYSSDAKIPIPNTNIEDQTKYKNSSSYADLTQIPGLDQNLIDTLVTWRNQASLNGSGSPVANYYALATRNPTNFLSTSNTSAVGGRTDRMFTSRQQLIDFFKDKLESSGDAKKIQDALQYFGTFSRSLNQPSLYPAFDDAKNPNRIPVKNPAYSGVGAPRSAYKGGNSAQGLDNSPVLEDCVSPAFRKIRVKQNFTRLDGSQAIKGEVLVKRRFALSRLMWLTYKGPSKDVPGDDPIFKEYIRLGATAAEVEALRTQGTGGPDGNIKKYFGLTWNAPDGDHPGGYWVYKHDIPNNIIGTLGLVANANREPDFFELLKASINVASIARAQEQVPSAGDDGGWAIAKWQAKRDSRVDMQILQIGANIIDAAAPDSYATQIVFSDGTQNWSFWGKVDLPYFQNFSTVSVLTRPADPVPPNDAKMVDGSSTDIKDPGQTVSFVVPTVWNPQKRPPVALQLAPKRLRIALSSIAICAYPTVNSFPNDYVATYRGPEATGGVEYKRRPAQCAPTSLPSGGQGKFDALTGSVVFPKNAAVSVEFEPGTGTDLYREPTPLWRMDLPSPKLYSSSNNLMGTNGITEYETSTHFTGLFLASNDIRVTLPSYPNKIITLNYLGRYTTNRGMHVSLEYQREEGGDWIPYQQYDYNPTFVWDYLPYGNSSSGVSSNRTILTKWAKSDNPTKTNINWDPRSGYRWAISKDYSITPFLDASQTTVANTTEAAFGADIAATTQNVTSGPKYADADGIIRRAIGGFSSGGIGLPMKTPAVAAGINSRPINLNRPFRSVSELGYVFSDTPWKNLDFFTPESGDAPLLDIFCINDQDFSDPLTAGKIDLNTRQPLVIQSILAGAYRDEFGTGSGASLTQSEAESLATKLVSRTSGINSGQGPLENVSEIVGRYIKGYTNPISKQPFDGFAGDVAAAGSNADKDIVQRFRETSVRALSDTGMAGTWNLLIDIIAQAGRYSSNASDLKNFNVEGEARYWMHVSIDRQTGKVIDKQIEVVRE